MKCPSQRVRGISSKAHPYLRSISSKACPCFSTFNYQHFQSYRSTVTSPTPGDVIIEASVIDEGWMEGRVERTGEYGMLPSNYVQKM